MLVLMIIPMPDAAGRKRAFPRQGFDKKKMKNRLLSRKSGLTVRKKGLRGAGLGVGGGEDSLFPAKTDPNRIHWPTESEITKISTKLAKVSPTGLTRGGPGG